MSRPTTPGLKAKLDRLYRAVHRPEFIRTDPVQFPRRYTSAADIEIAAFLTATIAWGRRDLIIRSAERMFRLMEDSPAFFVMSGAYRGLKARPAERRSIHRTFFEDDLRYFCQGLLRCYEQYGSLESLFASAPDLWGGMSLFRETMARGNRGLYSKHIANPQTNSACKRLNLALRWLVRDGPVDIGLWKRVSPASLFIPLDLHVGRSARLLGLLDPCRSANDKKAVLDLTVRLREFSPEDPVKYDFALFGLSAEAAVKRRDRPEIAF